MLIQEYIREVKAMALQALFYQVSHSPLDMFCMICL